jgi:acetyl/propionyl-CoA carboxylase alpha subunit/acetyl-CoA carboxylase carboxyltransferase component
MRVLIANRGEIAIRIARAADDLGLETVAVFAQDDAGALHTRRASLARALPGSGVAAYLDMTSLIAIARDTQCRWVHPGYGFLAENPRFAQACEAADLVFVGPDPHSLGLFGDKLRARALAKSLGVPVLPGTTEATTLAGAQAFMAAHLGAPVMVKAVAGGGGRGMRIVRSADALPAAFARCAAEAQAAFGDGSLYLEALIEQARHLEVQVIGDGSGAVSHLWERDCSLQRSHQKLIEVAPSPWLPAALRDPLLHAACTMAASAKLRGLTTFEFLFDARDRFFFIEANPRLQVEHTITEAVTGVDLVQAQLRIAQGATLAQLGLTQAQVPPPQGFAIQLRVNAEQLQPDGSARPAVGTLSAYEPPAGPGVRVDGCGFAGAVISPAYDSLLAKLVVHAPTGGMDAALRRARRAAAEFIVQGVATSLPLLASLLARPEMAGFQVHTRFIEAHAGELIAASGGPSPDITPALPVLEDGLTALRAPLHGTVVSFEAVPGQTVAAGAPLVILEAMKMQHVLEAASGGIVRELRAAVGQTVAQDDLLVLLEAADVAGAQGDGQAALDLDRIRPDLAEAIARHAMGLDEARPAAVARRHASGARTARENIADLVDEGSFVEYGALAIAAQWSRRTLDDLHRNTPADGIITGLGTVNAAHCDTERARCLVLCYDYTVLAGTQGAHNHKKTDRVLLLAEQWRVPVVLFAEGGGGRPGDVDWPGVAWLDVTTFHHFARMSGLVPRVGVVNGYCFAGNAAILGCCDVIIATASSCIGMGGPAMIEGGGLGKYRPQEVGPMSVQVPNGVVDIAVRDEAEAVAVTRQYLSYFQGPRSDWSAQDPRKLRHLIPENRLRVYDIREVIDTLCDDGSVLELRRAYGVGIVTALVRIEGEPFALIANDPRQLGGAIDAVAAEKAGRFLQLADAFDLPVISLCDTPGFMVGPQAEEAATVRRVSRMFVTAASMTVPVFTVVLRKGYGLGAQAMAAGGFAAPFFTIAWPSGEFGAMGIEGSVRLGFRKEMEAIDDPAEREAYFQSMVAQAYERGKALNMAAHLEIDDVIDPAQTRHWILRGLRSVPKPPRREGRKRNFIDTW